MLPNSLAGPTRTPRAPTVAANARRPAARLLWREAHPSFFGPCSHLGCQRPQARRVFSGEKQTPRSSVRTATLAANARRPGESTLREADPFVGPYSRVGCQRSQARGVFSGEKQTPSSVCTASLAANARRPRESSLERSRPPQWGVRPPWLATLAGSAGPLWREA